MFRHGLILLWFIDLMNVTEEVTIHRPNVSTLLSSSFFRGDVTLQQEVLLYDPLLAAFFLTRCE